MVQEVKPKRIAVVGGGIAGLSTAFFLSELLEEQRQKGEAPLFEIDLIEAKDKLGGLIGTRSNTQGFQWEAGPSVLITVKQETQQLCKAIGIWDSLEKATPESRQQNISYRGEVLSLPPSPWQFVKQRYFSWKTYACMIREPFKTFKRRNREGIKDISIGELLESRFGKEFLLKTVGPLVNGVFAGDPYRMSAAMCFPQWWGKYQKWGSLSKGWWEEQKEKKKKEKKRKTKPQQSGSTKGFRPDGGLASPRGGMEELVHKIQQVLKKRGVNIILKAPLEKVSLEPSVPIEEKDEKGNSEYTHTLKYQGIERKYKQVVFCTPPCALGRVLAKSDSYKDMGMNISTTSLLQNMALNPVIMVTLGFSEHLEKVPQGFGTLVAPHENTPLLSVVMHSRIFAEKCGTGQEVLHGTIGGECFPEWIHKSDQELTDLMLSELKRLWGIETKPLFVDVNRHPLGMPQYHTGHKELIGRIQKRHSESTGVYFGGASFWGSGLNNGIAGGARVAEKVNQSYV
jgi:oxygen-dependent protoporphyrinogen oxidase